MQEKQLEEWGSLGNVTILSIEDDSFNQEMAASVFMEIPTAKVLKAKNGREGIEMLRSNDVDVVLLDLIMPEMDGFEALEIIKKDRKLKDIPVIVVTSKEDERKRTYKLGANDFISKPYSPTELQLRTFNHLCRKKFCTLLKHIAKSASGQYIDDNTQLTNIKESLRIAECFQMHILEELGNLAHGSKSEGASHRLADYAELLARLYGSNNKDVTNLGYSMLIYDIGLLRITHKDIDQAETKEYRTHPELGLEILQDLEETEFIKMAKDVTIAHHENWDGSGFPNGLKGDEIPLFARMAALVDFYDELTSKRTYTEESMGSDEALQIMKRESGGRLDPELLEIFANNFEQFKAIEQQYK